MRTLQGADAGGAGEAGWVERLRELHLLTPLRIVIILVAAWTIAVIVKHLVTRVVRSVQRAQDRVLNRADAERLDQRRRTLTTVMRSTFVSLVWFTAFITVLGELGVNLGAFVATATIIGGALAFGAQTLVRDLISGFFLIAENQFGVGDVVDAGAATGTVERVSLRVTRLRDDEGRVWYLPNGQITRVANLSQSERTVYVDVTVSSDEDLAAVGHRLEQIANQLRSLPDLGAYVTGDAQYVGVEELHPATAHLRVRIPCRPGGQALVRRAFLAAVADAERRGVLREVSADSDEAGDDRAGSEPAERRSDGESPYGEPG